MKQTLTTIVLSLAMLAAMTSRGLAADKETLQIMADIRILQQQFQQVQLLLGSLAESLKTVDARLTQKVDDQADATRRAFADQKLAVDALTADLRVVREKVDDSGVRLGSLTQEVDALRQTVVTLTLRPPPQLAPENTDGGGVPGADPSAVAAFPKPDIALPVVTGSPQRVWDIAYNDYTAGDFDIAIIGFESYVRSFPTSERADDAQVYVCESYSLQGNLERAVEACDLAIRTYPTGDALPEAYYRKGVAERGLQRLPQAQQAFEYVVRTYPNSPAATLSLQRLEEMKRP